jgi:hypothetical protein
LLPALQIDAVLDKPTIRKRREALKEMPRALYYAFGVTIERIQSQKPDTAKQAMDALKWIFIARESLTLEELSHALAVEPNDKELDCDNFVGLQFLLECYLGLVVIDEYTSSVRLVHKSLEDYLTTQYNEGLLFQEGHFEISRICLTYMSFKMCDLDDSDREHFHLESYENLLIQKDLTTGPGIPGS